MVAQERLAAERAYEELMAEQVAEQDRAQRGYTQQVQQLQRQAAGSAEDLAGQLASAGLDFSPAAAFGAEQMTQEPLVSGSIAARGSLDQYLGGMASQKTRAKSMLDQTLMDINKKKKQMQVGNTLASQLEAYRGFGGF
jgi:hypothetical protein